MKGTTTITMDDPDRLLRLFSWLSPAFPIGGFAYSQGLETAIVEGQVADADNLTAWLEGQLHLGSLRSDAFFLSIAAQAVGSDDVASFAACAELALALQVSSERYSETTELAQSFLLAAQAWPVPMHDWLVKALERPVALPIAFGALAASHAIARRPAVLGFINAAISQQISVVVRLVPLGQTQGLAVLARLERATASLAECALTAKLSDIGTMAYGTDIASQRHEDLSVRIFRS